jgi:dTDP-4-amino-4,6-dideoxygalactose transaminase
LADDQGSPVPFFDLRRQTRRLRAELAEALMEVVDSGQFVLGPAVRRFEEEVTARLSIGHAIGVASGSDALLLALMAAGVGPGTEVVVPAFSFFSTASSAVRLGARVVFADIDPESFQSDPASVSPRLTGRTRAIVVVHLFGDCAPIEPVLDLAADRRIPVIEDAAQAFGARRLGRWTGTLGQSGCFSFYPTKNLAALGDAGMVVTDDDSLAASLRRIANHGVRGRYEHVEMGVNSRLDSIQAASLSVRLRYLDEWNQRRRALARRYSEGLSEVVGVPSAREGNQPVFHQYVIRTERRDALRAHLAARGIGTEIYYPIPLHLQKALGPDCGKPGDCPGAEQAAARALALPIFPELEDGEAARVVAAIRDFFVTG